MQDIPESPFLDVEEAAQYLRLKKRTLDNMRWQGIGPKFRKHGGRILYHITHHCDIVETGNESWRFKTRA